MFEEVIPNEYKLDDTTFLKKGKTWRLIYPYKINNKLCWKNILRMDWFALGMVVILLVIVLMYRHDMLTNKELISNPCKALTKYCASSIIK